MCAKLCIRFLTITQVLCHFPIVRSISMHFRHISRETAESLNICQTLTDLHLSDFEDWSSSNQTSHNLFLVCQRFSDFDESDFEIAAL